MVSKSSCLSSIFLQFHVIVIFNLICFFLLATPTLAQDKNDIVGFRSNVSDVGVVKAVNGPGGILGYEKNIDSSSELSKTENTLIISMGDLETYR